MKFSRLISTIFIASTFACIFLFAGIFWFYSNADSKTLSLLKDSLSTASGFFGGITTLIAAYIASTLFNDWRDQENELFKRDLAHTIYNDMGELLSMLLAKNDKFDIEDLQFKFHKINTNLLLYSKKEESIKNLIHHFGVIYTKQIGIYEKHKKNNTVLKIQDNMNFLNEYSAVLHTVAKLVVIDISSADVQSYLEALKNTLKVANPEWIKEKTDEILNEVKKSK